MFRRHIVGLIALCVVGLGLPMAAQSAEVTLRFGHFWPANAVVAQDAFKAWAEAVEKDSDGRIKVDMYPSQTLVKADTAYQGVVNGIADITATVQGYTAHRFPLSQVVELPGIVDHTAEAGSCIVQTLFDKGEISDEYDDTHVLFLFTHGPGMLHTTKKAVHKPEDLKGLRIRRPTTVVADMLRQVGAKPVGMPASGVYQSLQRGVIDGTSFPWEALHSFSLEDLLNHHTVIPLYVTTFVVTMNKQTYQNLPDDLKKVIDDNSGLKWAEKTGRVFDGEDAKGLADAKAAGDEIYKVEGGIHNPDWAPLLDKTINDYLDQVEDKGKPAHDVYRAAMALKKGQCNPEKL